MFKEIGSSLDLQLWFLNEAVHKNKLGVNMFLTVGSWAHHENY